MKIYKIIGTNTKLLVTDDGEVINGRYKVELKDNKAIFNGSTYWEAEFVCDVPDILFRDKYTLDYNKIFDEIELIQN